MNLLRENDIVFPLSAGAVPRPALRAPSLSSPVHRALALASLPPEQNSALLSQPHPSM